MKVAKSRHRARAVGLAIAVVGVLWIFHVTVTISRQGAIGKYASIEFKVDDDLELRRDGTYAYSFRPRVGVEFSLAGRWDFEQHLTFNVVILREFAPKFDGAPGTKSDRRFFLTEDSGRYRLKDSNCDGYGRCTTHERPVPN
jgi:hypothetical protein